MPTTVEIKGEFEIKIKRLIEAGLYGNIAEAGCTAPYAPGI